MLLFEKRSASAENEALRKLRSALEAVKFDLGKRLIGLGNTRVDLHVSTWENVFRAPFENIAKFFVYWEPLGKTPPWGKLSAHGKLDKLEKIILKLLKFPKVLSGGFLGNRQSTMIFFTSPEYLDECSVPFTTLKLSKLCMRLFGRALVYETVMLSYSAASKLGSKRANLLSKLALLANWLAKRVENQLAKHNRAGKIMDLLASQTQLRRASIN